jgi:hypothetical protein
MVRRRFMKGNARTGLPRITWDYCSSEIIPAEAELKTPRVSRGWPVWPHRSPLVPEIPSGSISETQPLRGKIKMLLFDVSGVRNLTH